MTNGHTYETKADSQTWRTDLWLSSERVWVELIQTIIYKMDEQGPTA